MCLKEIFFETIKCDGGKVFCIDYHEARIYRTISLHINLNKYISPKDDGLLKCKVLYDKNGIIEVLYETYKKRDIYSFRLVFDDSIIYKYKSLDRSSIEKLLELKNKADEIIIIKNSLVTDTSIANIAILLEGKWLTPAISLLDGTTKDRLIDEGFLHKENINVDMLKSANKIALLNAMIGFDKLDSFKFL